jgi:hypothetical protein
MTSKSNTQLESAIGKYGLNKDVEFYNYKIPADANLNDASIIEIIQFVEHCTSIETPNEIIWRILTKEIHTLEYVDSVDKWRLYFRDCLSVFDLIQSDYTSDLYKIGPDNLEAKIMYYSEYDTEYLIVKDLSNIIINISADGDEYFNVNLSIEMNKKELKFKCIDDLFPRKLMLYIDTFLSYLTRCVDDSSFKNIIITNRMKVIFDLIHTLVWEENYDEAYLPYSDKIYATVESE